VGSAWGELATQERIDLARDFALRSSAKTFALYRKTSPTPSASRTRKRRRRYRRFAKLKREEGKSLVEAALEGAKLRLRAILMTSLAFILGCRAADARERLWCRLTRCHGHRSRVWYDHRDPDRHLPYSGLLRLRPEPRGDAEKADASYPCARTRDSRTLMSFGR
jgi:hypothetical protein